MQPGSPTELDRPPLPRPPARSRLPDARRVALAPRIRRYTRDLARIRPDNAVTILRGGDEIFPAMLAAITAARREILLETYILVDDGIGNRFAAALAERAHAGVKVRITYDAVGALGIRASYLDRMRDAGCQVVEYHPVAPWRERWSLGHRDHRKILVIDDEVGFTGGVNISDDYAGLEDGGRGWHDVHCEVRGPIVHDLSRLFRRTWLYAGGAPYPAPVAAEHCGLVAGTVPARMIDNTHRRRRRAFRRAYKNAINAAQRLVAIQNAYFLPDRGLRAAMYRAVERGVVVQVIVPGNSDVKALEYAGLYVYRRMAKRGVRVARWKGPMMHAKAATVDAAWSTIGSYNLDSRSLRFNLEVSLEFLDEEVGQALELAFHRDLVNAVPFDERAWTMLPWWKKVACWFFFQLRRWL